MRRRARLVARTVQAALLALAAGAGCASRGSGTIDAPTLRTTLPGIAWINVDEDHVLVQRGSMFGGIPTGGLDTHVFRLSVGEQFNSRHDSPLASQESCFEVLRIEPARVTLREAIFHYDMFEGRRLSRDIVCVAEYDQRKEIQTCQHLTIAFMLWRVVTQAAPRLDPLLPW